MHASVRNAGDAPEKTTEHVFDVTDPEAIARAAAAIDELDALVDNAGIAIASPLEFLPQPGPLFATHFVSGRSFRVANGRQERVLRAPDERGMV